MRTFRKLIRILTASKRWVIWIILFILSLLFIYGRINAGNFKLVSPFVEADLKSIAEDALYQTKGKYGIYIKNLKSGEEYHLNEGEKFDPGSLYKLKVMVLVFEKIKAGSLKEDETLAADIAQLNKFFEIPDDVAEFTNGAINFTIKSALEQMITISHNYAALALTKRIDGKDLASPTTPKELGAFFEKLYKGEIIDKEYSQKMLELLKRQKINDRTPKYLPKEAVVAHKTGDIGYFEHDGGIVFTSSGDYVFVVLSESSMPDAAGDRIARLSEAVYKYFMR